jgi:hypothetical protein
MPSMIPLFDEHVLTGLSREVLLAMAEQLAAGCGEG